MYSVRKNAHYDEDLAKTASLESDDDTNLHSSSHDPSDKASSASCPRHTSVLRPVTRLSEVLAGRFDNPRAPPLLVVSVVEVAHPRGGGAILQLCDHSDKIVAHMDEEELRSVREMLQPRRKDFSLSLNQALRDIVPGCELHVQHAHVYISRTSLQRYLTLKAANLTRIMPPPI
eukprot:gene31404-37961_t